MKCATLLIMAVPVLALGLASLVSFPKKLIYNASASAPIGFYWIDKGPIKRGDLVLVRVPKRIAKLVEKRGYLPPDVPLIKRVMGLNGDMICRADRAVLINGKPAAVAQRVDSKGRPLPVWSGCHRLDDRQVFLLQDYPRSFDARYFGPLDRRLIIGRATKLSIRSFRPFCWSRLSMGRKAILAVALEERLAALKKQGASGIT